jgi:hypothetical protein
VCGKLATYVLNLVLVEVWYPINDNPGQRATKVDHLMHHKGHDARSQHIILHVRIPGRPHLLEHVEVHIVFGYLIVLAPVRVGERGGNGRVPGRRSVILSSR